MEVIIIGGGIIGLAISRELSKYKVNIRLFEKEKDLTMGSTKGNSGIIHGGYAESHESIRGPLCYQGRLEFEKLSRDLDFPFLQNGSLVLSYEESEGLKELYENGLKNGLKDLTILHGEEVTEKEPLLENVHSALYCEGAGVVTPYEVALAFAENAVDNGVKIHLEEEVLNLKKEENFIIKTNKDTYSADILINAAGLYADDISGLLGVDDYTIQPRKGEYLLFQRGVLEDVHPVIFQMPSEMGKGVLITHTPYGNLLLGPNALDGVEKEDLATDLNHLEKIYKEAEEVVGEIPRSQMIRSYAGNRSVSSTGDFIIRANKIPGFFEACGIQSPGITSSPAIAKKIIQLIEDFCGKLEKKEDFISKRKGQIRKLKLEDPKEILEKLDLENTDDEKVLCRCEQITVKDLKKILDRKIPVKTIDGIKRRTGAGMGFCQGSFCKSRILVFLEEKGISIQEETDVERKDIERVTRKDFN